METGSSSLGGMLRRKRAERGISLAAAASELHVPVRYIHALEADDFGALPPAVYTRALVREYARYLKIGPAELLEYSIPTRPQERNPIRPAIQPLDTPLPISGKSVLTVAAITMCTGLFMYLYVQYNSFAQSVEIGRAAGVEALPTPASRAAASRLTPFPTPTLAPTSTPQPTPTPISGLVVETRVLDRSWLQVWSDGQSVLAEPLGSGAARTFTAGQSIRMRVGNAGGVDVTVNGVHQGRLGTAGQVLDVSWSRE